MSRCLPPEAELTRAPRLRTPPCADPQAGLISVLLTNRVYPRADERSERAISHARRAFNAAVLKALGRG